MSHRDIICSMVTIVNNTILYIWILNILLTRKKKCNYVWWRILIDLLWCSCCKIYKYQIIMLYIFESPWDSKEIKPVHPKGNQSWIFIGRTDVKAEAPVLWPPDAKSWLIGKDPDAGKVWRREWVTQDEMVGWHHRLNGQEFEQTLGDSEGQRSLVCSSSWSCKGSDTT